MFKPKYTKWITLGNYHHAGVDYIVFARRNIKTSMLKFRVKTLQGFRFSNCILPLGLIDVKASWDELTNDKNLS